VNQNGVPNTSIATQTHFAVPKSVSQNTGAVPIAEVLRVRTKEVFAATALYLGGITVPFYTVSVFLVYYSTSVVHISRSAVLLGVVVSSTILLGSTIMGGVLADKIGRRSMFLLGVLSMAVFASVDVLLHDGLSTRLCAHA
jgi:Na+/melibiose symporter-like transporter